MKKLSIFLPCIVLFCLLISCTKEAVSDTNILPQDNLKYKIERSEIPPTMGVLFSHLIENKKEVSEAACVSFAALNAAEYIEYINFLAIHASEKYGISEDTALWILAKRIDYSSSLFDKMPNKLTVSEARQVGNAMQNIGLPVSVDPKTWYNRNFMIEKTDKVILPDSLCLSTDHLKTIIYPAIRMPGGFVVASTQNALLRQLLDSQLITCRFDQQSADMLRIDLNLSAIYFYDFDYDDILDKLAFSYHY